MAKPNTYKSRVSAKKRSGFKFRWWMGLVLVAIVAVIGVAVIRFSQASGGWCDQYFASSPRVKKIACYFAIDDVSTKDPGKVTTGVSLQQSSDPETLLPGAEAYYFDTNNAGPGALIWGGPNKNFTGLAGKNLRVCWWLRDMSGNARVNMVIRANGRVIAQDNATVSGSYYNKYCLSQKVTGDLSNTSFELRLLSGRVRANRLIAGTGNDNDFK